MIACHRHRSFIASACGALAICSAAASLPSEPPVLPDLNGDGFANALDAYWLRAGGKPEPIPPDDALGGIAGGETIVSVPGALTVKPGAAFSIRLRLDGSEVPLFGYSLAVRAVPVAGAVGSVAVSVAETTLYPPRNLILAAPSAPPIDPLFTVILPWATTGVFINANTQDLSTVLALPDINDVLAEVHFTASADAAGTFVLELGQASVLGDGFGFPVPFAFVAAMIEVDPDPGVSPDLNGDGAVNAADLAILLGSWGGCPTLPPDLNGDGVVGAADLAIMLGSWGSKGGPPDLNEDGIVNAADLANLLGRWGDILPPCPDLDGDGDIDAGDLAILLGAWG